MIIIMVFSVFLLFPVVNATDLTWRLETVDIGGHCSLALDSSGNPHIAYYRGHELIYASRDGSGWSKQFVGSLSNVDLKPCFVMDSKDNPHISYSDNGTLYYASWNNKSWNIQMVDHDGRESSLALDSDDNPYISYRADLRFYLIKGGINVTESTLMCANLNGSIWNTEVVDQNGSGSSIALDTNGKPHISYSSTDDILKYASWTGLNWDCLTVDAAANGHDSICLALDSNDNPHISFFNEGVDYATWNGTDWKVLFIDDGAALFNALAVDSAGNPHIIYDADPGLGYTYFNGTHWKYQSIYVKYVSGGMGAIYDGSIAVDAYGNPHICFDNNDGLKYGTLVEAGTSMSTETLCVIVTLVIVTIVAILFLLQRKSIN
jgi:hypothetical protein